jgi:hypothetical protein
MSQPSDIRRNLDQNGHEELALTSRSTESHGPDILEPWSPHYTGDEIAASPTQSTLGNEHTIQQIFTEDAERDSQTGISNIVEMLQDDTCTTRSLYENVNLDAWHNTGLQDYNFDFDAILEENTIYIGEDHNIEDISLPL